MNFLGSLKYSFMHSIASCIRILLGQEEIFLEKHPTNSLKMAHSSSCWCILQLENNTLLVAQDFLPILD